MNNPMISVTIEGLVVSPGTYKMRDGAKLSDLLVEAKGIKRLGRRDRVALVRGDNDNLIFIIVNLNLASDLNRQLNDGDRLFVELRAN